MHTRLLVLACCLTACAQSTTSGSDDLREISHAEALADFDEMVTNFRALYGAMERKQQKYNFTFDTLAADYRARVAATTSEPAVRALFTAFLGEFHDAHLSLAPSVISDSSHGFRLPFSTMPVEDTFVVYSVEDGVQGITRGDELLSIDGVPAATFVNSVLKYVSMPFRTSALHEAAGMLTGRSSYLSDSVGKSAKIKLRNAAGAESTVTMPWIEVEHLFKSRATVPHGEVQALSLSAAHAIEAELAKFGTREPFFMTAEVKAELHITDEAKPNADGLKAAGLSKEDADKVNYFAVKYSVSGKRILMIRLPDYQPEDSEKALRYLMALIRTYESSSDVLVLDQTHNPGGSLSFAEGVVALLSSKNFNGPVQRQHADRRWIQRYAEATKNLRAAGPDAKQAADDTEENGRKIDDAYSAGKSLSVPVPFAGDTNTQEIFDGHWTKPVLVLADELSVSCGDLVPLIVQANGIGRIFGERTMGGGGTVEEIATLANTQMVLSLSRGLNTVFDPTGAYPDERFVEDNGVTPDVRKTHTLADFRKGYVGYVQAINAAALQSIP